MANPPSDRVARGVSIMLWIMGLELAGGVVWDVYVVARWGWAALQPDPFLASQPAAEQQTNHLVGILIAAAFAPFIWSVAKSLWKEVRLGTVKKAAFLLGLEAGSIVPQLLLPWVKPDGKIGTLLLAGACLVTCVVIYKLVTRWLIGRYKLPLPPARPMSREKLAMWALVSVFGTLIVLFPVIEHFVGSSKDIESSTVKLEALVLLLPFVVGGIVYFLGRRAMAKRAAQHPEMGGSDHLGGGNE